jgi:hypothetical protein
MAELHQIASNTDLVLVFDGRRLHKKAFTRKGSLTVDHAAVVAGVLVGDLQQTQAAHVIDRMQNVKRVFKSRVEHYAHNWCVENARKCLMRRSKDGGLVESYTEILTELESNPRMESFQNWYHIYYKDFEGKCNGKREGETRLMNDLNIVYHDYSLSGGCVGELLNEVMAKLLENLQKRSRDKQRLHLTKSRPGKELGNARRVSGDYFIIRSDGNGKNLGCDYYNVSDSDVCLFGISLTQTICYLLFSSV